MKIKKLLPVALSVVLLGTVGIGATLAYFTDSDSATNVVTMGHVNIELTEPAWTYDEKGITNVSPGQTIEKDPTITLQEGSLDAYIRVKLEVEGVEEEAAADVIELIELNEGWTLEEDGYYYYKNKLTSDASSTTMFNQVTIPYEWDNSYIDKTFDIKVYAEAIQADNLAENFINENGTWNIEPEKILEYNTGE